MSGAVVWFVGLPSSGKSTLARAVAERLLAQGERACVLDGDEVRAALTPSPGYDPEARDHFYATLGDLAALLARQGLVVLVAATAHRRAYRDRARRAAPAFAEIYVATPLEECERRDSKGLYARARAGELDAVPGIDEPLEAPEAPAALVAPGDADAPGAVAAAIARIRGAMAPP